MGSGLVEALTGGATGAIAQAGISRLAGRTREPRPGKDQAAFRAAGLVLFDASRDGGPGIRAEW